MFIGTRDPIIDRLAKKYRTPWRVQKFIQTLRYNSENSKVTLRSARSAIQAKEVHCIEAAFVAASILEIHGYPPVILDFESQDGLDHVVFVFQQKNLWGAIGRSREKGLEGRAPVYRSLKSLAWSYFDPYVDDSGRLQAYQFVHLDDTKANWRSSPRNVWKAENYLLSIPHLKMKYSTRRYNKLVQRHEDKKEIPSQKSWW